MRLIDAEEVKKIWCNGCDACQNDENPYCEFLDWMNKVPTVESKKNEWIPIKFRGPDDDEKEQGYVWMFDCPIPDDGEETLVTDGKYVWCDTWCCDDGWYLDSDRSFDEITAWMPMPKPYKE